MRITFLAVGIVAAMLPLNASHAADLAVARHHHHYRHHRVAHHAVRHVAHHVRAVAARSQVLPDPKLTPGATNPDITQDNIHQTICNNHGPGKHWTTKLIRPPANYTTKLKRQQIEQYGFADKSLKDYEEDHLISLTLGGHPRDPKNLWPEAYAGEWGAKVKDRLENKLHDLVCGGTLTLKQAQTAIRTDWVKAYKLYVK